MKELRDQLAHAGAAILCLSPIVILPGIIGGAISGFFCGMVREITEEGEVSLEALKAALGSWKDLCGWTLGGVLLGLFA